MPPNRFTERAWPTRGSRSRRTRLSRKRSRHMRRPPDRTCRRSRTSPPRSSTSYSGSCARRWEPRLLANQMGEAGSAAPACCWGGGRAGFLVVLDSGGDVDGAGFLFWGQCPVQAVVAEGVAENVKVDGQGMIAGEPYEPVERDSGVGVLGHLVELVGLPAPRGDNLHDDFQMGRGQWPQVVGGAVEQRRVRAPDRGGRHLP